MPRRWMRSRLSTWMIVIVLIAVVLAGWHRYQRTWEAEESATAVLIQKMEAGIKGRVAVLIHSNPMLPSQKSGPRRIVSTPNSDFMSLGGR